MSSNNRFCNECKMCCHKKQLKAIQKAATWIKEKLILSRRRIFHYAVLEHLTKPKSDQSGSKGEKS